jgi:hypothetical protein
MQVPKTFEMVALRKKRIVPQQHCMAQAPVAGEAVTILRKALGLVRNCADADSHGPPNGTPSFCPARR